MPLTPFHFGPAFLLSLIFMGILHIPTMLVGSVILDIEPLGIMIFDLPYLKHGLLHSYLYGGLVAIALSVAMYAFRKPLRKIMGFFLLGQDFPYWKFLLSAFAGVYSHIFLDSLLHYEDMFALQPFSVGNPLPHVPTAAMLGFCIICFVVSVFVYILKTGSKPLGSS